MRAAGDRAPVDRGGEPNSCLPDDIDQGTEGRTTRREKAAVSALDDDDLDVVSGFVRFDLPVVRGTLIV